MSEFIGSRISLISKSDIKYVGTLHEINSETSTVALENVKSFGTEGRRGNPDDEIPPNDQIYDYIVFRGSDVKDLTIVEPPKENKPPQAPQMPNDPAILGAARPPHGAPGAPGAPLQGPGPQGAFPQPNQQWRGPQPPPFSPYGYPPPPQANSRFGPPAGPHGFPGAPPGYYGPPPGWFPPPGQGFPQGPPGPFPPQPIGPPGQQQQQQPPQQPPQQQQQQQHQQQPQQQQQSASATPQLPVGAPQQQSTPAQEIANAFPPSSVLESKPETSAGQAQAPAASTAPPPPVESKPDIASATAPAQQQQQQQAQPKPTPTGPRNNRVAIPLAPLQSKPGNASSALAQQQQSATQTAAAAVAAAMAKLPVSSAGANDASVENLAKRVGEMRTGDRIRHSHQPGTGGFAAGHRGRGGRRPSNRDNKPVEVPTTDFDFEGSNAKFNKQDMVKEAIATGSPLGTPTGDGEVQLSLNGPSGIVEDSAPAAEPEVVIPNATTYNKSSSFFDNISSELKDRQAATDEGKRMGGMEFRTEERKKNFETFGQGSVDNGYRGGFRGRGRGRGFSRGPRGYGGRGGFAPRGNATRGRGASFVAEP